MWASHVPENGIINVIEWPDPEPTEPGEFVVKMAWASICGSDLHAVLEGRLHPEGPTKPGYPGHEGVGVVVKSRSEKFREGDVVLTLPLGQLGGCFAEYQLLSDEFAIHLPEGGDYKHLMIAQQYGTVVFAMKNFWPREDPPRATDVAVVHGAGSAGLFFVQECFKLGFDKVICSDLNEGRLRVAAELGAIAVKIPEQNMEEVVAEHAPLGADFVIDAVGSNEIRNECIREVRRHGVVGLYGLSAAQVEPIHTHNAFMKCARLQFSVSAQSEPGLLSFHEALRAIHADEIRVDYCVGPEFPLDRVPEALQVAFEQGHGDVKITVDLGGL